MNMAGNTEDILNRRWPLRGKFHKQVAELLHTVRMSRREVEGLQILYDDIQHTFSMIWPGCIVKAFGSVVTGLALKGSDVDCYLEQLAPCHEDSTSCVKRSRDLIANSPTPFQQASVIIKKVPIVQFFHAKTGRQCELSFNKPIAVEIGKLVGYILELDNRALKLAVLIKCWAKIQKVTGRRLLPSSALIILIIFFLQQKKILPSVATLQQNSSVNMIDSWNTAFKKKAYKSSNRTPVYDLLGEFFAYYSEFDFRDLIVCPYLGYPVERNEFMNIDSVPRDFQRYKENLNTGVCENIFLNSIICIQDPFDHARNCTGHVRPQVAGEIIHQFQSAAIVYADMSKNWVLNKLLSYQYSEPDQQERTKRFKRLPRYNYTDRFRVTPSGLANRARKKNNFREIM